MRSFIEFLTADISSAMSGTYYFTENKHFFTVFTEIKEFFSVGFFAFGVVFHPRGESLESRFMKMILEIVELDGAVVGLLKTGFDHDFSQMRKQYFRVYQRIKTSLLIQLIQAKLS